MVSGFGKAQVENELLLQFGYLEIYFTVEVFVTNK